MDQQVGSEIKRILNYKGVCRLGVKNDFTKRILNEKNEVYPGIKLNFIESKQCESWVEYKILYSIVKYKDSIDYLTKILDIFNNQILKKDYSDIEADFVRLVEFDSSEAGFYYVLLSIIQEDKEEDNTKNFTDYE